MTMLLQNALGLLVLGLTLGGQVQSGKIIGGKEAAAHSRPYMVLLERQMINETLYCGGFLLSDEFVLTAAHCKASIYYIHVGLHKFMNSTTRKGIEVSRAVPHKEYSKSGRINDLMLLKLSNKVKFTNNVREIKLASKSKDPLKNCTVSGWGQESNEGELMALKLRVVNVTIIEDKNCAENNAYCSKAGIGPGKGDSGGPLVCEDEVAYGLVAFKTKGEGPLYVFEKIPHYLPWIQHQMKKLTVTPARHI